MVTKAAGNRISVGKVQGNGSALSEVGAAPDGFVQVELNVPVHVRLDEDSVFSASLSSASAPSHSLDSAGPWNNFRPQTPFATCESSWMSWILSEFSLPFYSTLASCTHHSTHSNIIPHSSFFKFLFMWETEVEGQRKRQAKRTPSHWFTHQRFPVA